MKRFLFIALLIVLSCSKDEGSVDCIYQHALETSEATNITDTSAILNGSIVCLLYTSPSPRDATLSRMPSSA